MGKRKTRASGRKNRASVDVPDSASVPPTPERAQHAEHGIEVAEPRHDLLGHLIAAGLLTNTPEHLVQWITHAQELKPGARMPSMELTVTEISALSAFLSTLN